MTAIDGYIVGVGIGMIIMLLMCLIAMRLTSNDYVPVREKLARNIAGGYDWNYTPDRSKH